MLERRRRQLSSIVKRLRFSIRQGMKRPVSKLTTRYLRYLKSMPLDPNAICYESCVGAGMICNPLAIFRELVTDPERKHLRHIWVVNNEDELDRLTHKFRSYKNVTFVLRNSKEYLQAIASAKYLVQNTSFPSYFSKRPGQVCINTWHSTTVKTLGYDMPDGNIQSRNVVRSLLMSDYVISPNSFMTDIFRQSYRLEGLFEGKILELGYPRNDLTFHADRDAVIQDLGSRGIRIDPEKQVILYAPTWRGSSVSTVQANGQELLDFRDQLLSRIDTTKYQVLIKPHQLTHSALSDSERDSGNFIPRQVDANELLAVVDVLISDYSSIFFDFMITDRPVLFYIPDKDSYLDSRGVYFSFDNLPGPVTASVPEIAGWINNIDDVAGRYRERYLEVKSWACPLEDGHASERVVRAILDGEQGDGVVANFLNRKKRILFYVSSLGANGVTSSFRALLAEIDRAKYDVTVFGLVKKGESTENFRALRDVRVMPRYGGFVLSRWETFGIEYVTRYGFNGPLARIFKPQEALARDFRRCFGDAQFDYIVDYSGYGLLFPSVFRQDKGSKKIIWQHNDVASDIANAKKRRLRQYSSTRTSKTGLINTYGAFDKVVACSREVMEVNRANLATPRSYEKFTYVPNLIEQDRVASMIDVAGAPEMDGFIVAETRIGKGSRHMVAIPDAPPAPSSGEPYIKFVTIGRLSPEKNHDALIRGFAAFAETHPNSRLIIIGGGDLRGALTRLCVDLGIDHLVSFTGNLQNPFAVAKRCDCFILPSLYEGFGLVVPEIRILGLPIILSNFKAAQAVAIPGGQYTIGFSADEIKRGMQAYFDGAVPAGYSFDARNYNAASYARFERILETI